MIICGFSEKNWKRIKIRKKARLGTGREVNAPMYSLRNSKTIMEDYEEGNGDASDELVNRKIQLRESSFDRLDEVAERMGISRAELVRCILQWFWDEPEIHYILTALQELEKEVDELEEYVRPETDEEYKEAGRLLRAVRNHIAHIEEEVRDPR